MQLVLVIFLLCCFFNTCTLDAQWIKQSSGTTEQLTDVVMIDSVTAVAVGRGRSILRTTDAGKTWTNTTIMLSSVAPWNAVDFCNDSMGIAVGDGQIRIAYDGGVMWMFAKSPANRNFTSVLFNKPDDIYVGDDSGWVHHSTDTARTWTSEQLAKVPILKIYSAPENSQIYPDGAVYLLLSHVQIIKETNKTWYVRTLGHFNGPGSSAHSAAFSNQTDYVVGIEGDKYEGAAIIRLRPQDAAWHSVGPTVQGTFTDLSIPEVKTIYVCGTEGMIYSSLNDGDNWTKLSSPTEQTLRAIFFIDSSRGFAVGDSGTILFTENSGGVNNYLYTAGYFSTEAETAAKKIYSDAGIRRITANNVTIEGKAQKWQYKFMANASHYDSVKFLYFSNQAYNLLLDSISTVHDCCVMNITEDWKDSDSALAYAEANGGKEFREANPGCTISALLNQALTPQSHPQWSIEYLSSDSSKKFWKYFDARRTTTPLDHGSVLPQKYKLYQNYPNPFNPVTNIRYSVGSFSHVSFRVYDILGNEIETLVNKELPAGEYITEFDAAELPSGVYFYVLNAGGNKISRKMILLR